MASYNKRISDQSKVKFNPINRELEDSENSELDSRVDNLEENILGSKTATGNPITVSDAAPVNAVNLSMDLEPIQAGSGTPSPDNIRPISGRSEVAIHRVSGEVTDTYTIQLGDTYYGGTLDVTRGKMVVDRRYIKLADQNIFRRLTDTPDIYRYAFTPSVPSKQNTTEIIAISNALVGRKAWDSYQNRVEYCITGDGDGNYIEFFASDLQSVQAWQNFANENDVEIVYKLAEPYTIDLTPLQIKMLENTNTLYTDYEGDTITIEYQPNNAIGDVLGEINDIYDPIIDDIYNKIGSLDTRVTALEKS